MAKKVDFHDKNQPWNYRKTDMREDRKRSYTREEPKKEIRTPIQKVVSSIMFGSELYCFKKGDSFQFEPGLNLFVGDQGCGKSTLMKCMMESRRFNCNITLATDQGVEFLFMDTEKDNPRVKKDVSMEKDIGNILVSHFQSHGEALLPRVEAVKSAVGYVIFIDEPEAALSIRSQVKIVKALRKASKSNQIFVATHSPYIIRLAKKVLDLERRIWTDPEEFIKYQENG